MFSEDDFSVFEAFYDENENLVIRVWKEGLEQLYERLTRYEEKSPYIFDSGAIEHEQGVKGDYYIRNLDGGVEVTHTPSEASARKVTLEDAIETLSTDLQLEYGKHGLFLPRECGVDHPLPCGEDPNCKQEHQYGPFEKSESFRDMFGFSQQKMDEVFTQDVSEETDLEELVEIRRPLEQRDFGKTVSDSVGEWRDAFDQDGWSDDVTNSAVSVFYYDNPQCIKQVRSWEQVQESLDELDTNRRRAIVLVNSIWYVQEQLKSHGEEVDEYWVNTLTDNPEDVAFDGVSEQFFARQMPRILSLINLRDHLYDHLGELLEHGRATVGKIGEDDAHPSQLEIAQIVWKALFEVSHHRAGRFEANLVRRMLEIVREMPDGIIGHTPSFRLYSVNGEVAVSCRDCGGTEQVENLQNQHHECDLEEIDLGNGDTLADRVDSLDEAETVPIEELMERRKSSPESEEKLE